MGIEEIFLGTHSLSLAKAFNKFFNIWTDIYVQQKNLAQLFKEATERSAEMLIKTLGNENTICFLAYCWMPNSDFFSCPTILRIRALFPIMLQVLHLLSLLFRQINYTPCAVNVQNEVVYFGQQWEMMVGGQFQVIQWCYEKLSRCHTG